MLTDLDYELLSAYIDSALSDIERAAFEVRLHAEAELRSELDELRATVRLLNNLPVRKAPRNFTLDARYVRRTPSIFTSATFSALSSAAAIILFAVGAYLFAESSASKPTFFAAQEQVAQLAFLPSATAVDTETLDKSVVVTATQAIVLSEIGTSSPAENSNGSTGAGVLADGLAQESPTVMPPLVGGQLVPLQGDTAQATQLSNDASIFNSAPAASEPADTQRHTDEATETDTNLQSAPSSGGELSSAAAIAPPSQPMETSGALAFPATQLPITATAAPTQTAMPLTVESPASTVDMLPVAVIVLGIMFLLIAIGTTIVRQRNRL